MALNDWQKITRVITGKPFGNGQDGAYSSATIPTLIKLSCSGTATSTALTASSTTIADGDLVMIHQTRGTGVGQWEINKVASGGGTVNLVMQEALYYTYTDSGASQAQVVKIFQYTDVTVQAGTWTVPSWGGDVGGVFPMAVKGTLTPTGTISGSATGFVHKGQSSDIFGRGRVGENTSTAGGDQQNAAVETGGGGGGGGARETPGGGAGGGHATSGTNGAGSGPGVGGGTDGGTNLDDMVFGGAGGSGGGGFTEPPGYGGSSGGIIAIYAKSITSPTSIISSGGNGTDGTEGGTYDSGDGGGGSGGSILLCSQNIDIGIDKLSTVGGTTGTGPGPNGGTGGKGRIAVYYGTSTTGSVSATYYGSLTSEEDTDFVESNTGLLNFI